MNPIYLRRMARHDLSLQETPRTHKELIRCLFGSQSHPLRQAMALQDRASFINQENCGSLNSQKGFSCEELLYGLDASLSLSRGGFAQSPRHVKQILEGLALTRKRPNKSESSQGYSVCHISMGSGWTTALLLELGCSVDLYYSQPYVLTNISKSVRSLQKLNAQRTSGLDALVLGRKFDRILISANLPQQKSRLYENQQLRFFEHLIKSSLSSTGRAVFPLNNGFYVYSATNGVPKPMGVPAPGCYLPLSRSFQQRCRSFS